MEGAETKVLADDQEVSNYMIDLGDLLETVGEVISQRSMNRSHCAAAVGDTQLSCATLY